MVNTLPGVQAAPIVRVAIEPADPGQMQALAAGLRLLNRADPFVEVTVQESGEHVIGAAGARALLRDDGQRGCNHAMTPWLHCLPMRPCPLPH